MVQPPSLPVAAIAVAISPARTNCPSPPPSTPAAAARQEHNGSDSGRAGGGIGALLRWRHCSGGTAVGSDMDTTAMATLDCRKVRTETKSKTIRLLLSRDPNQIRKRSTGPVSGSGTAPIPQHEYRTRRYQFVNRHNDRHPFGKQTRTEESRKRGHMAAKWSGRSNAPSMLTCGRFNNAESWPKSGGSGDVGASRLCSTAVLSHRIT